MTNREVQRTAMIFAWIAVAAITAGVAGTGSADPTANPYCVSGANAATGGVLDRLDMPAGSIGYIWDSLQPTNPTNMVRPCKYWLATGRDHQAHGYHPDDKSIHDPETFGAWIDDHPGQVWIIGNEPNLGGQDGLSPDQYVEMYYTYRTFILDRDPTARIAVGALSGDARPGAVDGTIDWWRDVLGGHRSHYGARMEVDIWNFHLYCPTDLRDAHEAIELYVDPFVDWVRTVERGAFADCEIWLTEFGVGLWTGDLNPEWALPMMQRYCLELESADVDRWFWFLGPWDGWSANGDWQPLCLLDAARVPTQLGEAYAELAHGWPNDDVAPLPDPVIGEPLGSFADAFDDENDAPWFEKAGTWTSTGGVYRCTGPWRWHDHNAQLPYRWRDSVIEFDVRVDEPLAPENWGGVALRRPGLFQPWDHGAGLVYVRGNGEVGISAPDLGTVASAPGAIADTTVFHRVRVSIEGSPPTIAVAVDGELLLEWTGTEPGPPDGTLGLQCYRATCSFDNVEVRALNADDPSLSCY